MAEKDQEFVEFVVKQLVDTPDAVSTQRTVDEMGVLITLTVDPKDLGQVIGRQGQTAKALRTLLRVVGAKHQARVNLKIYEPEGTRPNRMSTTDMDAGHSNSNSTPSYGGSNPAPQAGGGMSSIDNLDI